MVTRLWAAEARGPEAVAAVQREMQVVLDQADALGEAERAIVARNREIADGLSGIVEAGQAAFDPAQLDPYLAQMQELGLLTARGGRGAARDGGRGPHRLAGDGGGGAHLRRRHEDGRR